MSRYLLIDGNSLGYWANDSKRMTNGSIETQAIFHFLSGMREILTNYEGHPIVIWDGKAQWRFDLWPLYKGNRDDTPKKKARREAYKAQRPYISKALEYLGIEQITCFDAEADDVAGHLSRLLADKGHKVDLFTGDMDWMQLVNEHTRWIDRKYGRICTLMNFKEMTDFDNPLQFVEAKALKGDVSDNIPGVGGFGEAAVREFFELFVSVEDMMWLFSPPSCSLLDGLSQNIIDLAYNKIPKTSKKYGELLPMQDAFLRNMKLMDLRSVKVTTKNMNRNKGSYNPEAFEELCEELGFNSILTNIETFLIPFNKYEQV